MRGQFILCCAGVAAAWLLPATAAEATCNMPRFNGPSSGPHCNGCQYEGTISMARDEICQRVYQPAPGATPITYTSNRVIQRAKHGIAGANGNTFAYAPGKGFTGTDEFVVEVAYREANTNGKFRVHFVVHVE